MNTHFLVSSESYLLIVITWLKSCVGQVWVLGFLLAHSSHLFEWSLTFSP